jgi:putative transposase
VARRLRIQFPGAIYHVINRGNYRRDLFLSAAEAKAFLETVREARDLMGWRVHAYVLMRNHYHLAIETPEPNLVEGMHWLQSTWAV